MSFCIFPACFKTSLKPQSGTVDLRSADCISSLALSSLVGLESLNFTPADPSNAENRGNGALAK